MQGFHKENTAAAASLQVSAAPVTLVSLVVVSTGSAQYIQVFDSATAAADSDATAVFRFPISDGSSTPATASITFTNGVQFRNGIYVCNSSTLSSKTIGSANCYFTAVLGA